MNYLDVINRPINLLTALRLDHINHNGIPYLLCKCECGRKVVVNVYNLRKGQVKSCGCLRYKNSIGHNKTHGLAGSHEYCIWVGMKQRCYNPNHLSYKNYGGRGIRVCERWLNSFENFLADMGRKPSKQHSIERKDNNGHYEPSNCIWATMKEQNNNKRKPVYANPTKKRFSVQWALCDIEQAFTF